MPAKAGTQNNPLKTQAVVEKRGKKMNDEHINEKDFTKYGESKLSPHEFLRVQTHLENCEDCERRLKEMFPNIAEMEEGLLIEDLSTRDADDFHLNYEEHLKPFIYGTISAIDKEIVESHVEICAACREDLRDLLVFHRELEQEREIRELSRRSWWTHLTDWFSHPNHKAVWLAVAAILIFIGSGLAWLFLSKPSDEIVKKSANPSDLETNQSAPKANINQATIEVNQNTAEPKGNSNTQNQNTVESPKEVELANLVLPKFLGDLRIEETGTRRGSDDSPTQKIAVISPKGSVIRDSSPVLKWQNVPNIQDFEVSVFDNDFNPVAKIDSVSGNSWRVPNLTKGKIYQWQVSAKLVTADGKTTKFLGQSKFYIISERDENRIKQAKDGLEKGRAFAEAGLLREAAGEFRKYLKENPNSENAKKFLRQVEQ